MACLCLFSVCGSALWDNHHGAQPHQSFLTWGASILFLELQDDRPAKKTMRIAIAMGDASRHTNECNFIDGQPKDVQHKQLKMQLVGAKKKNAEFTDKFHNCSQKKPLLSI